MIPDEDITNRFEYHAPRDENTVKAHQSIRNASRDLADMINTRCPDGREKSTAITKVEEAMMWANAAIARNNNG